MREGLEQGVAIFTTPEGEHSCSTFTCNHCNKVVHVKPGASPFDLGGLCGHCNHLICPDCVNKGVCNPFMDELEKMEAKLAARQSYGF